MISTPMIIIWWIIVLIAMLFIWWYNKFIWLKNTVDGALADIDVQMKMRFDLIENLVNTVKWYASHEKETLTQLTEARTKFLNATSPNEKAEADTMLAGTLKTLFSVTEAYPELKANTSFLSLQTELSSIEDKIASARRYFNATIKEYNIALQSFPNNIIASIFWFTNQTDYFATTTEEERKTPKVTF
jgi:LemA protein